MGGAGQIAGLSLRRIGLHVEDVADPRLIIEAAEPLLDQPFGGQHLPDALGRRRDADLLVDVVDHESPSAMRLSRASFPPQYSSSQARTSASGAAFVR